MYRCHWPLITAGATLKCSISFGNIKCIQFEFFKLKVSKWTAEHFDCRKVTYQMVNCLLVKLLLPTTKKNIFEPQDLQKPFFMSSEACKIGKSECTFLLIPNNAGWI